MAETYDPRARGLSRFGDDPLSATIRIAWGVIAYAAVILYTLVAAGPILVLAPLFPRAAEWIARCWCRFVIATVGARVTARGLEGLPSGNCILVANHQSYFDICALVVVLEDLPRFVAKRELRRVPVFGPVLPALGQIVIDRDDPSAAKTMIDEAARSLRRNLRLCFFAEGTRSVDGSIGPFKKGAAVLGVHTRLPLVPVSISGTRKLMSKADHLIRPGGEVRLVFGEPISTERATLEDREALTSRLRAWVVQHFDPTL